jgi:hypothetical protein
MKKFVFAFIAIGWLGALAFADEVVYDASQDSEVDEDLPTLNFGAEPDVEVYADWEDLPTLIAKPLFQFPIDIESWAIVDQAVLQLHVIDNFHDPGPIAFFRAGDAWDEGTVVWDNRPSEDKTIVIEENAPEVIVNPVLWEIDVTDIVQAWVSGDPNHGFYVDVPDNDNWVGVDLATRENPDPDIRPKLWINYWLDDVEEQPEETVSFNVSSISNRSITVSYNLHSHTPAVIHVYDASGTLVKAIEADLSSGNHSLRWDGEAGVYFVKLMIQGSETMPQKAVILD